MKTKTFKKELDLAGRLVSGGVEIAHCHGRNLRDRGVSADSRRFESVIADRSMNES
jgi:hypothetical protein